MTQKPQIYANKKILIIYLLFSNFYSHAYSQLVNKYAKLKLRIFVSFVSFAFKKNVDYF